MSRKATLATALPIVAAHYGEKFGVKVVIGGSGACTDGQTIIVPNVPEDYPNKDVIWGYTGHEASHVKNTNFDVWNSVSPNESFRQTILNEFEDSRIEKIIMDEFPGVRADIESVVVYLKTTGGFLARTSDDEPGSILQSKIRYWLRANVLQQPVQDLLIAADNAMYEVFPNGVNTRLEVLLRKAAATTSTADCLALTDSVIQMLEEEKEKEQDQSSTSSNDQTNGDDSPADNGDDSAGEDDLDSNDSSEGSDSTTGQQNASSVSKPDGCASKDMDDVIGKALGSSSDELCPDPYEVLKEELLEIADQSGDDTFCTVPIAPSCRGDKVAGKALLESVKGTTTKVRAQLLSLVQAARRSQDRAKRRGRKIDSKRVTRILSGDTRIFRSKENRIQPNTAVHLLTDLSSSMDSHQAKVAREASLAIALALEGIPGVSPAVTYFSGNSSNPVKSALRHGESARLNAHHFIEPTRGTTPMAEAIWHGAFELSKHFDCKKLMIVITDGDPTNEIACHTVLDLCKGSEIDVVGIGICHPRVERLFERSIVINSVEELRSTLFSLVRDKLINQAA